MPCVGCLGNIIEGWVPSEVTSMHDYLQRFFEIDTIWKIMATFPMHDGKIS